MHRFNVAKTLDIDGLIALFDDHCRQDEWREVLRLICGQIDEAFVGRIVERLATRTDLEKWDRKTPLSELPLAIGCLSETRAPSRLEAAGSMLMRQCIAYLESGGIHLEFWFKQVIPASRELGERWPGKACVYDFKHPRDDQFRGNEVPWVTLIATVDSDREKMLGLLNSMNGFVVVSALWFLGHKWPDETTRALLEQRAVRDNNSDVRSAALQVLAAKWPDETTRALLEQRAVQDDNYATRSAALQALAEKWPDAATRALLEQRAVQDDNYATRSAALQALAAKWPDETTRALLEQRAVQDLDDQVRGAVFSALARCTPSLAASCRRET